MSEDLFKSSVSKDEIAVRNRKRRRLNSDKVALHSTTAMPLRNDLRPLLRLEERKLAELSLPKRATRKLKPKHIATVVTSYHAHGQVLPPLIRSNGEVVDGVVRIEAAKACGLDTLTCIVIDHLSDHACRELRLSLNRIQEQGEWDWDETLLEIGELLEIKSDLVIPGFDDSGFEAMLVHSQNEGDDDVPPRTNAEPCARLGDLIYLGRNRLFCGDARDPESYSRLMQGELARMVSSDPPYFVKIAGVVSGKGAVHHEDFIGGFGNMSKAEYAAFISSTIEAFTPHLVDGAVCVLFADYRSLETYLQSTGQKGLQLINIATWDKGTGMGGLYRNASEFAVITKYGTKPICNRVELGRHGRDRTTVWRYPGATQRGSSAQKMLAEHPTPKSVEMIADSILDVTEPGDIVLDMFCGSGSAIVAAEKTRRRAYSLELDPKFVDVIVRRWEEWAKRSAVHENGMTFAELAEHRKRERAGEHQTSRVECEDADITSTDVI
jgi:DNA modification methylase